MSTKYYNPFKYLSKNCSKEQSEQGTKYKKILIVISSITLILISVFSIFLYMGIETTVYFKNLELNSQGIPINRELTTAEFPVEPFTAHDAGVYFTIYPENITRIELNLIGFLFMDSNLLERLIQNDTEYYLFFLEVMFSSSSTLFSDISINIDPYIQSIKPYLYNNSFTSIAGNIVYEDYKDLVFKFKSGSYCIPVIGLRIYYIHEIMEGVVEEANYDVNGMWTLPLITHTIDTAKLNRGVYEIQMETPVWNYTTLNAFGSFDIPQLLTATRPPVYFEDPWISRSFAYDKVSIFTPINEYSN